MKVSEAATELEAAIRTVASVRVYRDYGASIDPPAAILGPPRLQWEVPCSDPTTATFLIYVGVTNDGRAVENLWSLVPEVAAAIDSTDFATVIRADPGIFPAGNVDLPAYELTVEVSL